MLVKIIISFRRTCTWSIICARFVYLLNGRSTIHFEAPFKNTEQTWWVINYIIFTKKGNFNWHFFRDTIALSRHRHLRMQKKTCVNIPIKWCVDFVVILENTGKWFPFIRHSLFSSEANFDFMMTKTLKYGKLTF